MVRRWSQAHTSDIVVTVALTRDRYSLGEIVVSSGCYADEGQLALGDTHRVALGPGPQRAIPKLWDLVFDEVLRAQQAEPRSVTLQLDPDDMDGWRDRVATVLRLVGHELDVRVEEAGG
ncbi:MAG: hypothetical protein JXC32_08865 [Anaerolineae bacterium]|nr:hypothetical protein [Anaerolineae bacterium]